MPRELLLSGIDGSNPLGFLAALGVLLAVHESRAGTEVPRLTWRNEGLWRPVVSTVEAFEELVPILVADAASWKGDPAIDLRYDKGSGKAAHDLKPKPERFREYLGGLLASSDERSPRALSYAAAFGTETAEDNNGNVKPTALHFTAGQQEFLAMVEQLNEGVTADDFLEAVKGPWTYSRPLPVLQWDSTAARLYALRGKDPSTDKKLGVPGADWLAFRGLSFFPVAPVEEHVDTTGCGGGWKNGHFTWPLWTALATVDCVRTLVGHPELPDMKPPERNARGIGAVLRSNIQRTDQGGYGSFAPAQVL